MTYMAVGSSLAIWKETFLSGDSLSKIDYLLKLLKGFKKWPTAYN